MEPISIAVDRSRAAPRSARRFPRRHILSGSRALDHQHRRDTVPHLPFGKVILRGAKNLRAKSVHFANLFPTVGTPPDFGRVVQDHVQQGIMDFHVSVVSVVVDEP